jgi:[acyl-carrier-protein] S-malonyltransferase
MRGAVDDFRQFIEDTTFSKPESTVLFNATAKSETVPEKIKEIMARQLVSPVKWYDIMVSMLNDGADTFVEVGPKTVLTGLLKKSLPLDKDVKIYNVQDVESLKSFLDEA